MRLLAIAGGSVVAVFVAFVFVVYTGAGTCTQMGCIPMLTIGFAEPPTGFLRIQVGTVTIDECEFQEAVEVSHAMYSFRRVSATTYTFQYAYMNLTYPDSFADGITVSARDRCSVDAQELGRFSPEDIERTTFNPNGPQCSGSCENLRIHVP
jgi:hypothetical protein